jgi:hypothetical protein
MAATWALCPGVVSAGVGGPGGGIALGMTRHHKGVQLADQREGGTFSPAPPRLGADTGEGEPAARGQTETPERLLHQACRPLLFETELRRLSDLLAEGHDFLGPAIDGRMHSARQVVA